MAIDDPRTAIDSLHWLHSVLFKLRDRDDPAEQRFDGDGRLRLVAQPVGYESFARIAFDDLRSYFVSDENARLAMIGMLNHLIDNSVRPDRAWLLRGFISKIRSDSNA